MQTTRPMQMYINNLPGSLQGDEGMARAQVRGTVMDDICWKGKKIRRRTHRKKDETRQNKKRQGKHTRTWFYVLGWRLSSCCVCCQDKPRQAKPIQAKPAKTSQDDTRQRNGRQKTNNFEKRREGKEKEKFEYYSACAANPVRVRGLILRMVVQKQARNL